MNIFEFGTFDQIEKHIIFERLKRLNGNKPEVAKSLNISLKTLYNKLNSYELYPDRVPDFKE